MRHPIVDFRLHRTTETDHRLFEIFRRAKSRTWEEARDAALALAQIWVMGPVAVSPSAGAVAVGVTLAVGKARSRISSAAIALS